VQSFLLDNVLEYTDKMSMALALEVRVPLLDHRFVELSLNVPFAHKLRDGRSKLLLHQAFSEFFPPSVRGAPKRGFNAPLPQWMHQTLDGYFETSLRSRGGLEELQGDDPGATWQEGILDWSFISQLREQHRRGKRDNSYELFAIIMFDVWWRKYVKGSLPMLQWSHPGVS
jgi:asparagine synthase (glutamine-hydrolysing)